jgi:epoxyqueuosine reductase
MSGERVSFPDQNGSTGAKSPNGDHEGGSDFTERVFEAARALGFDAVGIARADVTLAHDLERYDDFVAAGMHGEMGFLAQHRAARARMDGDEVLRGARSVVCVARRYQRPPSSERNDAETSQTIARYARGRDYHRFMRRRLRRLATLLRSFGSPERPVRARPMCDDAPVLERAWAARAGLGFVGKNGLLIVPGVGSMVLLGEVVTTLELRPGTPIAERCGSCTRCLDACPTQAFARPFVLDPRRCVSYLTIEHRSAIPEELAPGVGTHLFGCDECQTVCPFNVGAGARSPLDASDGGPFEPLERWSRVRLEDMLAMDDAGWRALCEGSPIRRAGRAGMARNAAIVLGNRGDPAALAALRRAAESHDDDAVRRAAAWAARRLATPPSAATPAGRRGP